MTFLLLSLAALAATPMPAGAAPDEAAPIEVTANSAGPSAGWSAAASAPIADAQPLLEEALTASPEQAAVEAYAQELMAERRQLMGFLSDRYAVVAQPSQETAMVWLIEAQAQCELALARLAAEPGFGDDRSALAAIEAGWLDARALIDEQAVELAALTFAREVRGGDLARVEALVAAMDDRTYAVALYTHRALGDFAARNGATLTPPHAPTRNLTLLGPDVTRNFGVRYHNMLLRSQRAMVAALNGFLQTPWIDPSSVEEARVVALAEIQAELTRARAHDAWQGDDSLRLALVALGESLEASLEGSYAELPAAFSTEELTPAEEARFEQALAEGAASTTEALAAFSVALDGFRERVAGVSRG